MAAEQRPARIDADGPCRGGGRGALSVQLRVLGSSPSACTCTCLRTMDFGIHALCCRFFGMVWVRLRRNTCDAATSIITRMMVSQFRYKPKNFFLAGNVPDPPKKAKIASMDAPQPGLGEPFPAFQAMTVNMVVLGSGLRFRIAVFLFRVQVWG